MNRFYQLCEKPRTFKEICSFFGVSYHTMKKMLCGVGLQSMCRKKGTGSYFYQISELTEIVQVLCKGFLGDECVQ